MAADAKIKKPLEPFGTRGYLLLCVMSILCMNKPTVYAWE